MAIMIEMRTTERPSLSHCLLCQTMFGDLLRWVFSAGRIHLEPICKVCFDHLEEAVEARAEAIIKEAG